MVEILERGKVADWKSQPIKCDLCTSTLQAGFSDLKGDGVIDERESGGNGRQRVQVITFYFNCPVCTRRIDIELNMSEYHQMRAWKALTAKQAAEEQAKSRSERSSPSCDCAYYVSKSCHLCDGSSRS